MGFVRVGRGQPVTLFAPGEFREPDQGIAQLQHAAADVRGTRLLFYYEQSGYFPEVPPLRRQAERDAAEVLALTHGRRATRALGISRGARAVLGALADDPTAFERVVLVLPPGGNAVGYFREWLRNLAPGHSPVTAAVQVLGMRGDSAHPARVAEEWAHQLGAQLAVFDKRGVDAGPDALRRAATEFLNA